MKVVSWTAKVFLGATVLLMFSFFILLAYTGVWPPFVSVLSDSMSPNIDSGDVILITNASENGVETRIESKQDNTQSNKNFGEYGEVIIFEPKEGNVAEHDIIHRAEFWVEKGEDWTDKADSSYMPSSNCDSIRNCPAPNDGYITKGDNNDYYDQTTEISKPVPEKNIQATADRKIPYMKDISLLLR